MTNEEKQELTQERLMQVLRYDPSTGFFTWNDTPGNNTRRNKPAGSIDDGYVKIMLDRNTYRAHRLAFLYMTGEHPDFEVDHINRIRSDNRWSNLRKATHSQNMQNKCAHRNNVSGIKGVNFRKDSGKYRVMIKIDGKLKSFGQYDDLELAELVSSEVRSKYHKEFSFGCEVQE